MNSYQLVSEAIKKDIKLSEFDASLYDKYATKEDKKYVRFYPKLTKTHFNHTIVMENKNVGLICLEKVSKIPIRGIPQLRLKGDGGFIHVLIFEKYRGLGILKEAFKLIQRKYQVKVLWAIIKKNNFASIKAHKKLGFKEFSEQKMDKWINDEEINGFGWKKPLKNIVMGKMI